MAQKRSYSRSPADEDPAQIFKSSVIEDRASRFLGIFSPTFDARELQKVPAGEGSMHRMIAWRMKSKQRSLSSQVLYDSGHEDDGETYGGKTIEKVLSIRNVEGSIMVARWFGGTLLGPIRFEHMRKCANDAVSAWQEEQDKIAKSKRVKVDDDPQPDKSELAHTLKERDQSITVLRELLAGKSGEPAATPASQEGDQSLVKKGLDYNTMPVKTLQRLEQARDKTIAWLLAQIDKAEQSQLQSSDDPAKGDEVQAGDK